MAEVAEVRGRRREQRGWYFYDWANSAFSTTVATVFLGPYLTSVTEKAADARGFVHPLGIAVRDGSFFPYDVSLSVFLTVFVLPVVGAIADRTQRKKQMLATFAYLGAFATMGLFFVSGGGYLLGGALFIVANVSFGAAAVVYNAYLPEIAEPDERDAVSARGWAMGYLGGGLLLAANLVLFNAHARLDVSEGEAVRICLLSAGIWWAAWTVIPLRRLRRHRPAPALPASGSVVTAGFRQLRETFREARNKELDLPTSTLITAILVVQFVAFGGALLFGRLARAYGARNAVLFSLVLWTIAVALAFVLPARRALLFFSLAILIGVVLGGSQALSRSMFSQLIPVGREAAYFSLYEISERGTSWLGPLVFGVTYQATGSYRSAIISLIVFFAVGGVLLARVNLRRAIEAAGNRVPERV